MTKKTKLFIYSTALSLAWIGLSIYWFNWRLAVIIFIALWAQNVEQLIRKEPAKEPDKEKSLLPLKERLMIEFCTEIREKNPDIEKLEELREQINSLT